MRRKKSLVDDNLSIKKTEIEENIKSWEEIKRYLKDGKILRTQSYRTDG